MPDRFLNKARQFLEERGAGRSFLRSILTLSVGTAIAQAIAVLTSPIISRIYAPTDFDIFAPYAATVTIISAISTLKYEWAIVLADTDDEANSLFRLCVILGMLAAGLSLGGVIVYALIRRISPLYWLLPFSVLSFALLNTLTYRANRLTRYQAITQSNVIQSLSNVTGRVGLGLIGSGPLGLVLANILSTMAGSLALLKQTGRLVGQHVSTVKEVFRKYDRYARFSAQAALLNTLSYNFEYILFGVLFAEGQIGAYYFWNRLSALPKHLLARSIWQVFLRDSADLPRDELGRRKMERQGELIALTTMLYYSGSIAAPLLAVPIFGQEWAGYTNLIAPILLASHVNLVVSSFSVFILLEENRFELVFNAMLATLKAISLLMTYVIIDSFIVAVWAMTITQAGLFIFLGIWNYNKLGQKWYTFLKLYATRGLLPSAPFLLTVVLFGIFIDNLILFTIALGIANILYFTTYRGKLGDWRFVRPTHN